MNSVKIFITLILTVLSFSTSAQPIEYNFHISNPEKGSLQGAKILRVRTKSDTNGKAVIKCGRGVTTIVTLEGYEDANIYLNTDPVYRVVMTPKGEEKKKKIPEALQLGLEEPLYVVDGVYRANFHPENYTDAQIKSVTVSKKWDKRAKKVFSKGYIISQDVTMRGVVYITLAEPVEFMKSGEKNNYTIYITDRSGNPIPNATIYTSRAITGKYGNAKLKAKTGEDVIIYLSGYKTQKMQLTDKTSPRISLELERTCDIMPTFKKGNENNIRDWLVNYLAEDTKKYQCSQTISARAAFVVGKTGIVESVSILSTNHTEWAKAVKRALYKSPKWTPGIKNGKPVRVPYTIPVYIPAVSE